MIIKICGLKRPEDLFLAAELGADVVGLIMGVPESPRNNSMKEAKEAFSTDLKGTTQRALLFRSSPLEVVLDILTDLQPEVVHFCGEEDSDFRSAVKENFPEIILWQSVGVPVDAPEDKGWSRRTKSLLREKNVDQVVLDSAKCGKTGGVGKTFPLEAVHSELGDDCHRLVLAGGITLGNVAERINVLKPFGIDVSSGVESKPGIKDPELLKGLFETLERAV